MVVTSMWEIHNKILLEAAVNVLTFTAASYAKSRCNEKLGLMWLCATPLGFAMPTIDMNAAIGKYRDKDPDQRPWNDVN